VCQLDLAERAVTTSTSGTPRSALRYRSSPSPRASWNGSRTFQTGGQRSPRRYPVSHQSERPGRLQKPNPRIPADGQVHGISTTPEGRRGRYDPVGGDRADGRVLLDPGSGRRPVSVSCERHRDFGFIQLRAIAIELRPRRRLRRRPVPLVRFERPKRKQRERRISAGTPPVQNGKERPPVRRDSVSLGLLCS
jgi:hypothetical protein